MRQAFFVTKGGIVLDKCMISSQFRGLSGISSIAEANAHADRAAQEKGENHILRGTSGCIFDDEGRFVMMKTVQRAYRQLVPEQIAPYVSELDSYLEDCMSQCFGESRPDGYIRACTVPGSTGALHHAVCGYTEPGDIVLTTDWHWGSYENLCIHNGRRMEQFHLLNDRGTFDLEDFARKVGQILKYQDSLLILLNSPANNPTGYNLSAKEWTGVVHVLKKTALSGKSVILLCDVAYLDFSGEADECRQFFRCFSDLPPNLLVLAAYTMSKGFTLYGQRAGALICIASTRREADEFVRVCQCMSKCTWGSCNRAPMHVMRALCGSPLLLKDLNRERTENRNMISRRADIFTREAKVSGLDMIPYICGFFITVPTLHAKQICSILEKNNIFLVPLPQGIRIAVCSIPLRQMPGLAGSVKAAANEASTLNFQGA